MKLDLKETPRKFTVGRNRRIEISDFGKISLATDEMISFVTASGKEYDVTAKSWGFYATPSLNGRLKNEGFKTALVKNIQGRYYIMLVENEPKKIAEFLDYLAVGPQELVEWLDER